MTTRQDLEALERTRGGVHIPSDVGPSAPVRINGGKVQVLQNGVWKALAWEIADES